MEKTIIPRNNNRTKETNKSDRGTDVKNAKILRTVESQETFYFYENIGRPTGEVARNLTELLEKIQSAKSESLMFHFQRRDFENWIEKILGDSKLAQELRQISSSNCNELRKNICKTIKTRIKELKQSQGQIAVQVDNNTPTLLYSP